MNILYIAGMIVVMASKLIHPTGYRANLTRYRFSLAAIPLEETFWSFAQAAVTHCAIVHNVSLAEHAKINEYNFARFY